MKYLSPIRFNFKLCDNFPLLLSDNKKKIISQDNCIKYIYNFNSSDLDNIKLNKDDLNIIFFTNIN